MAVARPWRQHEQQPRIRGGAHLVPLMRVEDSGESRAAAYGLSSVLDLDVAVDDDQIRPFVDLVLLQLLARGQVDRDRSRLAPGGVQDPRLVRLYCECPQIPVLHGGDRTRLAAKRVTPRRARPPLRREAALSPGGSGGRRASARRRRAPRSRTA